MAVALNRKLLYFDGMVFVEFVLDPLLPVDDLYELCDLVREGDAKSDDLVVLGHLIQEVLGVGPERVRFFRMAHDLGQIDDQSVFMSLGWREVWVGGH
jgi:hypothetical protein